MAAKTFQVPTLVSDEDFEVVENALRQILGVRAVDVNGPVKEVTVRWEEPASWYDIRRTLADLGYVPETHDGTDETDRD